MAEFPKIAARVWEAGQGDAQGLAYSAKTKSLNSDNSTLFNLLQEMNPENLRLASPTGFEPVLPP